MFTMLVSLYTSRVILQVLGIDDYGIYQVVGGIVGFFTFLNVALATGTSRFLTFELGKNNFEKLQRTFSMALTVHIGLAILIVLLAETVGLWFLHNKMVIPVDRMDAVVFTYQISVFTMVFTITQAPYSASIMAHERMSIYAYVSIFETLMKLLIVYILTLIDIDKLKLFSLLGLLVSVGFMCFYRYYCTKHFPETKYRFVYDKSILKSITNFSGWSLMGNAAVALNSQGILILINMFFSPAVVAARAISIQVFMAINQFVGNFRTAVNPQIIKKYASGDKEGSKKLLLESTKYSFFLLLVLGLPIIFLASQILNLWLGVVPEYSVIFLQLVLVESFFQLFNNSLYVALYAKGQLKENALITPIILFVNFPIIYILFKMGYSPIVLSWISMISYAILGVIVKPILLVKIVGYRWSDIWSVFRPCFLVTILAIPIPLCMTAKGPLSSIYYSFAILVVTLIVTSVSIYVCGIDRDTRKKILSFIRNKISR